MHKKIPLALVYNRVLKYKNPCKKTIHFSKKVNYFIKENVLKWTLVTDEWYSVNSVQNFVIFVVKKEI
jgi:hypothetical protein